MEQAEQPCVLELRVHGVSGTPPDKTLNVPLVEPVAGDKQAGFYREYHRLRPPGSPRQVQLEAYSWGNLTSGGATRALWLLLLPFMLVNIAIWARPRRAGSEAGGPGWGERAYGKAVRLLAMGLTITLALSAVGASMDLIGWQCTGDGNRCGKDRSWLSFLTVPDGSWWEQPGRRLVVTSLVPIAVIALIWFLSRQTWRNYESYAPEVARLHPDHPMAGQEFWDGRERVGRLRSLHVAVALSSVTASLVAPALQADQGRDSFLPYAGWVLLSLAGLVVVAALLLLLCEEKPGAGQWWHVLPSWVRYTALATLGLALVYTPWSRQGWDAEGGLPYFAATVNGVFLAQLGVWTVLAVIATVLRLRNGDGGRRAGFSAGGPLLALFGLLLGSAFAAGVAFRVADWLDCKGTPVEESAQACTKLTPPPTYAWAAVGFGVESAFMVLALIALWCVYIARRRKQRPRVEAYYRLLPKDRNSGRTQQIAGARASASLTDLAPYVLVGLTIPALLLIVAFGCVAAGEGEFITPAQAADELGMGKSAVNFLLMYGSWCVVGFLVAIVALGRAAYANQQIRRVVGILWDVGTFWPRAAHPLGPPCYAERAVPELVLRIRYWCGLSENHRVILSAHSQGSILAAAAIWQLPGHFRERVCLISYGSPLSRLYARYFPAWFNAKSLTGLASRVKEWRNLWHETDPVGAAVRVDRPDGRPGDTEIPATPRTNPLPDPIEYSRQPGNTVEPPVTGHGQTGYTGDAAYAEILAAAVTSLTTAE
ncbi:hypothetical protein [Streptomyces sp. NPDC005408]|uniref:hypothetical protein n=1 Tax=Streptomyces sp. NPDC005408 TaxID=3155341 RepID=UPI0033BC8F9D